MVKNNFTPAAISNIHVLEQRSAGKIPLKKTRVSLFHVVVNTNRRFGINSRELQEKAEKMKEIADGILCDTKKMMQALRINTKFDPAGKIDKDHIIGFKSAASVERGRKFGQLHIHMMIKITHSTYILMNRPFWEEAFQKGLQFPSVYCKIKARRGTPTISPEEYLLNYINKNLGDL